MFEANTVISNEIFMFQCPTRKQKYDLGKELFWIYIFATYLHTQLFDISHFKYHATGSGINHGQSLGM